MTPVSVTSLGDDTNLGCLQDCKDDICLPTNVMETCGGNDHHNKVKKPISRRSDRSTGSSNDQWREFGTI